MDPFELLLEQKIVLEEKLELLTRQLGDDQNGALVDAQGYPHAGMDHYSISAARGELAKAQNDLKGVMKAIEAKLPEALGSGRKYSTKPFAVVDAIDMGGLADRVGLKSRDKLIQLDNITRYEDLASFRSPAILEVKLLRGLEIIRVGRPTNGGERLGARLNKL